MSDEELLTLIHENPEKGMHEMISEYGGAIGTICRNYLYDFPESDVEEAIADTFIHFWKKRESFVLRQGYCIKGYLYAIARNVARDKRRKAKREDIYSLEELSLDLADSYDLESELERRECEMLLHESLAGMKEPDKSIFLYRYFYGFGRKDIAEKLSLSLKQVENILYRGKEKLRRDLVGRRYFSE